MIVTHKSKKGEMTKLGAKGFSFATLIMIGHSYAKNEEKGKVGYHHGSQKLFPLK
jgi:hypothetical protein